MWKRARLLAGLVPALALATPALADEGLRLVVDRSDRELRVYRDGELVERHPVAVGMKGYATPRGTFAISRVDWNPDWTPPSGRWARNETYKPPGHPKNPMGRVRMVFKGPYAVHGTDAVGSLGRAASHGCIRLANDVIIELAPRVMEAGGAPRSEAWIQETLANTGTMRQVPLPNPVPITIQD